MRTNRKDWQDHSKENCDLPMTGRAVIKTKKNQEFGAKNGASGLTLNP